MIIDPKELNVNADKFDNLLGDDAKFNANKMINIFNYVSLVTLLSSNKAVNINFGRGGYGYKTSNFLPKIMYLSSLHIFTSQWQELKYNIERIIMQLIKSIYKKIK